MGVISEHRSTQSFKRYEFEEWVNLEALTGRVILVADAWEAEGKFGKQVRFVFSVCDKEGAKAKKAKVFGSSSGSAQIRDTLLAVRKDEGFPAYAVINKYESEKSPTGYGWTIDDAEPHENAKALLMNAVLEAEEKDEGAEELEDLPFN